MVVIAKPLKLKSDLKSHVKSQIKEIIKESDKPVTMTPAERAHRAVQKQRVIDKIQEGNEASYRQKVQQYNKLLASYSDHFDLKKTSD